MLVSGNCVRMGSVVFIIDGGKVITQDRTDMSHTEYPEYNQDIVWEPMSGHSINLTGNSKTLKEFHALNLLK